VIYAGNSYQLQNIDIRFDGVIFMPNENIFYQMQKQHLDEDLNEPGREPVHKTWFRDDTVDYFRHKRMYETIRPIAECFIEDRWVSIGDGRYGLDSVRLKKIYGLKVLPTDISGFLLEKGFQSGLLDSYKVENAERLSFEDNSFDFVFCKETLHHLPRPLIAIYEMLRVCKTGIIIIEPNDFYSLIGPRKLIKSTMNFGRSLFFHEVPSEPLSIFHHPENDFEGSGNFIYPISIRDIEKIVHGLNLPAFAWKGFNDIYIEGCEFELAEPHNHMFKKLNALIKRKDFFCQMFSPFQDFNMHTIVIFKEDIKPSLRKKMIESGFRFANIIQNPHLKFPKSVE
jgi:SAM-dependent methyltransferase